MVIQISIYYVQNNLEEKKGFKATSTMGSHFHLKIFAYRYTGTTHRLMHRKKKGLIRKYLGHHPIWTPLHPCQVFRRVPLLGILLGKCLHQDFTVKD